MISLLIPFKGRGLLTGGSGYLTVHSSVELPLDDRVAVADGADIHVGGRDFDLAGTGVPEGAPTV